MKNIRKYMMAAACMTAAAALVACTEAVKRDTEEEIQEMTVPKKPGPITKVPATLTCNGGEEFTFSVSKVQWAETYEWTIAEQEKSKISIIDGQGTNVITVRVVNDDVVIPAQSVSVVAKNELGASKVREYFAAITVSVPIELPGYTIKKYGKRWWMTENCHEAGEDGNLGVAPDLTAFSVAGLEASHLQRLNDAKGRYYTWYEAMTGISGCTAEQCPYVQNYEGVDDVGNAFKLDGTEEGEFGVQIRGCCPDGWHVPSEAEWEILYKYVRDRIPENESAIYWDGSTVYNVSGHLRANVWPIKEDPDFPQLTKGGMDTYGFAIRPSGCLLGKNGFYYGPGEVGSNVSFWTPHYDGVTYPSSPGGVTTGVSNYKYEPDFGRGTSCDRAYPVRCLQN